MVQLIFNATKLVYGQRATSFFVMELIYSSRFNVQSKSYYKELILEA